SVHPRRAFFLWPVGSLPRPPGFENPPAKAWRKKSSTTRTRPDIPTHLDPVKKKTLDPDRCRHRRHPCSHTSPALQLYPRWRCARACVIRFFHRRLPNHPATHSSDSIRIHRRPRSNSSSGQPSAYTPCATNGSVSRLLLCKNSGKAQKYDEHPRD
ncbi:hypothetical protein EJB05_27478, partial [Eragrostis curvula]